MNKINKIKLGNTTYDIHGEATSTEYGLIKIGYTLDTTNKNYPVELANGKAFVNVPWENTQYTLGGLMGSSAKGSGTQPVYWNGSSFVNTTCTLEKSVPNNAVFTDTTYNVATDSSNGLMSAEDKEKLNGIAQNANNYSLPTAGLGVPGGIIAVLHTDSVDFEGIATEANRSYQVEVDANGKAFVNVPWVASQGGGGTAAGFDSVSAGNTTISSSVQSDLYISSHGGTSVTVDQGISSLANKSVVYIDVNAATNTHYGGIKIDTQSIVTDPTAGNYPVQLTSGANSGFAYVSVPQQTLASLIGSNAIGNSTSFIYWDGSGFVSQAVPTGSSQMAISADPTLSNNTLQAAPNTLYRFTNPVSALTIQLQQPSASNVAVEYLFRFKTASSGVNITFTDSQDQTTDILYPFDYILNTDTEYEISVLYDGSKYLVRNCAYQSNS